MQLERQRFLQGAPLYHSKLQRRMDEFHLFNRALNTGEVRALYSMVNRNPSRLLRRKVRKRKTHSTAQ